MQPRPALPRNPYPIMPHRPLALEHQGSPDSKSRQKPCQVPHSVQKRSMSHHPNEIKFPPAWQMSYAPSGTINVVGLNRKGPATTPGLSPLRSQPLILQRGGIWGERVRGISLALDLWLAAFDDASSTLLNPLEMILCK